MQNENTIEHSGIVKSVDANHAIVDIVAHPACSGCIASGICDLSEEKNKEIRTLSDPGIKAGDRVLVVMKQSLGFRALFLGYLMPFIIVMVILIVMTALGLSEALAGISALLALVPYYAFIYFRKEKIGRSFSFTIKKELV
jgi:sigma-E factor negative regulatory protein RseC